MLVRSAVLLAAAAAVGCAHLPASALGVPAVAQATDYSCGPATMTAVLRYWKRPVACEQDLYSPLHTTQKDGTEPYRLEEVARANGLRAEYRIGATVDELRAALAAGTTVILDLQAWRDTARPWADDWDDGHYVVLVAIAGDRVYAMDPSADDGFSWLTLGELAERWHDFEMRDGQRRNLQHMAVFIAGDAHGSWRGRRPEKMR
ncbi:MAG TPA: C39 family peptidase [Polyangia bacterium]